MQEEISKLAETWRNEAAKRGPVAFYDATVVEVDADEYTCTIMLNEHERYEVRLRAVVSANHSIDVLPEAGSAVVVGKLADDDYIVIACDKVTEYRVTTGTVVYKIDSSGILISKGAETLNKILTDLVNGVLSVAAAKDVPGITGLLTRINNLLK